MTVNNLIIQSIQVMMFPDGRLDTKNAARYLGFEVKTLAMMRSNGTGPKFIKRGRIFYYKNDLDEWLNAAERCLSTVQAMHHHEQRQKEHVHQNPSTQPVENTDEK